MVVKGQYIRFRAAIRPVPLLSEILDERGLSDRAPVLIGLSVFIGGILGALGAHFVFE